MNHLKWLGHSSTILHMQKKIQHQNHLCDVKIINGSGKIHYAHKVILFLCSDFFKTIFKNYPDTADICTILIPDIKDHILENILNFIYTGSTNLSSIYLSEFLEHINNLGIKSAISFECPVTNLGKTNDDLVHNKSEQHHSNHIVQQYENLLADDEDDETTSLDKDVIEEDDGEMDAVDSCTETDSKNIQYLEVYNTSEGKLAHYSIEESSMLEEDQQDDDDENNGGGGDYILTEHPDNIFTLTEQDPLAASDMISNTTTTAVASTSQQSVSTTIIPGNKMLLSSFSSATNNQTTKKAIASTSTTKVIGGKRRKTNIRDLGAAPNIAANSRAAAFENAVKSVINDGVSLQKAAEKFHVSKTVLWRRVKKHPAYTKTYRENPIIESAIQRLERGESLKSVSHALQIPMSTLHRHKMRLADEGRLPENIQIKRRDLISKENLKIKLAKAVDACVNGMSQNHAASVYEVPKSTLWRHLQRRTLTEKIIVKMEITEPDENDKLQEHDVDDDDGGGDGDGDGDGVDHDNDDENENAIIEEDPFAT